jgi:hypothetical protein
MGRRHPVGLAADVPELIGKRREVQGVLRVSWSRLLLTGVVHHLNYY